MEMHMRLVSRVLENFIHENHVPMNRLINQLSNWNHIRHQAAIQINQEVKSKFQDALLLAYDTNSNPKINVAKLNKELAAARKDLAQFAKQALFGELLKINVDADDLEKMFDKVDKHAIDKHAMDMDAFKHTTATGLEYIRTDVDLESCVRFSAADETAHDKKKWDSNNPHSFATREIHRNDYIAVQVNDEVIEWQVKQADRTRLELRVPSIAVISLDDDKAVNDVAKKLEINYERLQKQLGGYDGPMTYNLLTALNFSPVDCTYDSANRQRVSAARILKGTHIFNRQQILAGKPGSLWLVENISVNQQGINLSYDRWDNATLEATLMGDIAMLNNFNSHQSCLPPAMRKYVKSVYDKAYTEYNHFLQNNEQGKLYFKDSLEGKRVIEQIKNFKEALKHNADGLQFDSKAPLVETASKALMKIMAMNKLGKKSYGPLVQSLSIFMEMASQHGCKSANEREALISNTVDLLDSIERVNQKQQNSEQGKLANDARSDVIAALGSFLTRDDNDDKQKIKKVRDELNKALNVFNLYGPLVSHEDQGASIKIEASASMMVAGIDFNPAHKGKLGLFDRFNTNIAVPREFTHLDSAHVSGMQAHKGDHRAELKAALKKAILSVPRSSENNRII